MLRRVLIARAARAARAGHRAGRDDLDLRHDTILYDADAGRQRPDRGASTLGDTIRFTRFGGADHRAGRRLHAERRRAADGRLPEGRRHARSCSSLEDGDDVAAVNAERHAPGHLRRRRPATTGCSAAAGSTRSTAARERQHRRPRRSGRDQVDCGDGNDTAITDDADTRISCEQVEGDADGDGVRRPADCDDTRPTIRPGRRRRARQRDRRGLLRRRRGRRRPRPRRHAAAAGLQRRRRRGPARRWPRRSATRSTRTATAGSTRSRRSLGSVTQRLGPARQRHGQPAAGGEAVRRATRRSRCAATGRALPVRRRAAPGRARGQTVNLHGAVPQPRAAARHRDRGAADDRRTGSGACCATRSAGRATRPTSSSCACRPAGGPSGC